MSVLYKSCLIFGYFTHVVICLFLLVMQNINDDGEVGIQYRIVGSPHGRTETRFPGSGLNVVLRAAPNGTRIALLDMDLTHCLHASQHGARIRMEAVWR